MKTTFKLFNLLLSISIISIILLTSCNSNDGPDLIPFNAPDKHQYCDRETGGWLNFYVKNIGTKAAVSSEIEVKFNLGNGVFHTERGSGVTGPLNPGEVSTSTIQVKIPSGCYNPDCNFEVTVDILNTVKETNEKNNTVKGKCIG